jgi:hypothetical protein
LETPTTLCSRVSRQGRICLKVKLKIMIWNKTGFK